MDRHATTHRTSRQHSQDAGISDCSRLPSQQPFLLSKLIRATTRWIQDYVGKGWKTYFISFMFKSLPGNTTIRLAKMSNEIDRVYSTLITRVLRNARSPSQRHLRPLLIAAPDRPVAKHQKQSLPDVAINDGIHFHAVLLIPPQSRLKHHDLALHFSENEQLYVKNRLLRIDVEPINDGTLPTVIEYMFKSIKRGSFDWSHLLVFPKSNSELVAAFDIFPLIRTKDAILLHKLA